jgi:hypothetical protein
MAIGCWLIGLAKVLSMMEMTLRFLQAAAIAATSTAAQRRVDGGLEPENCGLTEEALGLAQLLDGGEPRGMPVWKEVREEMQRPTADRGAAHHFVAGFSAGQERCRRGRHALANSIAISALDRGDRLLNGGDDRRVAVARAGTSSSALRCRP